jgi:hypothetical protein
MTDTEAPRVLLIPANFNSVVYDFTTDLTNTFPDFAFLWKRWIHPNLAVEDQEELFMYFTKVYPERFFDILYQNEEIFDPENNINTVFLPNVDFKILYHCGNITETTKKAIWKYLQLILISVLGSIQNKTNFGDTANLFEGFDENVIHEKLNETIEGISDFFKNLGKTDASPSSSNPFFDENMAGEMPDFEKMREEFHNAFSPESTTEEGTETKEKEPSSTDLPNAEDLHKHLQGLFDGKIGSLAKELAEEISVDMQNIFEGSGGMENMNSTQDILKQMIKNPKKMMDLMKTIGDKLQKKMKNGDITEEEIMKEASELMSKMKGMGGGKGGFADIMKNMAQGMLGKNARFNSTAFSNMEKKMSAKERMRAKLEQKRQMTASASTKSTPNVQFSLQPTTTPNNYVFSLPEEADQEKTAVSSLANVSSSVDGPSSSVKVCEPKTEMPDLETLAKEIESTGEKKTGKGKKKGKGKNK